MPNFTAQQVRDYNARMYGAGMKKGVAPDALAVSDEADLHDQILAECRRRGWIAIHCRMDMPSTIAKGIWDFTIVAEHPRIFFVECKAASGKLTVEQHAMIAWATKLGWTPHVCRSFEAFLEVVR